MYYVFRPVVSIIRYIEPLQSSFILSPHIGSALYRFVAYVLPLIFFSGSCSLLRPGPLIQFRNHFSTYGRTPWTSDQPAARPLPKRRTTQTKNKRIHTPTIHALSGIRTHDPSVRASENSSCFRPSGCCDRRALML
jgi:hypothetical protein